MGHAIGRRRLLQGAAASALLHGRRPARVHAEPAGRDAMARAAGAILAALDEPRRRRASLALGDAERLNWHYIPRSRQGLPFKDMPAPARAGAHELLKAALSAVGYAKAVNIMRLEEVLRQVETLHSVWHDPRNAFGADLLRAHYQAGHHRA